MYRRFRHCSRDLHTGCRRSAAALRNCRRRHPAPADGQAGDLSPDLTGVGSRWTEGQLRLRMVDAAHFNPDTIMPSFYRIDGLTRVAPNLRGKPILSAQEIEDVVAFLMTLKDERDAR